MTRTTFYGEGRVLSDAELELRLPLVAPTHEMPLVELPPDDTPSWLNMPPECKILSLGFGIHTTNGWQHISCQDNPKEIVLPGRRRYAFNEPRPCRRCGAKGIPWIDYGLLLSGVFCLKCRFDDFLDSYLHVELNRCVRNAVEGVQGKYLADDPTVSDMPLWEPGTLCHFADAMGSGKSYYLFSRAEGDMLGDGVFVYLVPRKTLAIKLWNERWRDRRSRDYWGVFYGGSPKEDRRIGRCGAIGVISQLPMILRQIRKQNGGEMPSIYLVIDEVDFAFDLLQSRILRATEGEIRDDLLSIVDKYGLVVAGQTEFTATLEIVAGLLNVDPNEKLFAHYKSALPNGAVAQLKTIEGDNVRNRVVAGTVESVNDALAQGLKAFAFTDGRRTAEIVASLIPQSILLDAYHRGDSNLRDMFYLGRLPDEFKVFVANCSLSVGASFNQPDARTTLAITEDLRRYGSPAGTVQQGLRNREISDLVCHIGRFSTALPISPSDAKQREHFRQSMKLGDGEQLPKHLVDLMAQRDSLKSHAVTHIDTFVTHHWQEQAGFEIKIIQGTKPKPSTVEAVKLKRKQLTDAENEAVRVRASEIVQNLELKTEGGIQRAGEQGELKPMPVEQLSHEYANQACQAVGWDGEIERTASDGGYMPLAGQFVDLAEEQRDCAVGLIQWGLDVDFFERCRRIWVGLHLPNLFAKIDAEQRRNQRISVVNRVDDRLRVPVVAALLLSLPAIQPLTLAEVADSFRQAFQQEYQGHTLAHYIAKGGLGDSDVRRFLKLGPEAEITLEHLEWASQFLRSWSIARLRIRRWEVNGEDQIVCMLVKASETDIVLEAFRCWVKYTHPSVSWDEAERLDLIPPHTDMPNQFAEQKKGAIPLVWEGLSVEEIAARLGMSPSWVYKHVGDEMKRRKQHLIGKAKRLDNLGWKTHAIGVELGVSHHTVKRWLDS